MKRLYQKLYILIICLIFINNNVFADNISEAESLIKKAKTTKQQEEGYDYLNKARFLLLEGYEQNPTNIKILLGLSKVNQMTGNRSEAKLYVLKAYNMKPDDPTLQKEMGDFFYNFQEYSTAVEYYKLALASGLLRDFETNLQTAKCFEKLGDKENAELYYKISLHLNSSSRTAMNKINEYSSEKHPDNSQELENARYKYLFKNKKPSEKEKEIEEAESIIESINGL